jgi:hypothetical protein
VQPIELESLEEILKANRNYRSCLTPGKPLIHIRPKLQREPGLAAKRKDFASRKGGLSSTGFRTCHTPIEVSPLRTVFRTGFALDPAGRQKSVFQCAGIKPK